MSLAIAALLFLILPGSLHVATRALCALNAGLVSFLFLAWWMMTALANPEHMQAFAKKQYTGRLTIYTLIIMAACVSVFALIFLLNLNKSSLSPIVLILHLVITTITILGSWLLVHTIFAFQYAHMYYRGHPHHAARGLNFPQTRDPDYWDFLYFSFVIGMTCQVSDVQTESRQMRHFALLHGILSFFFNTSILAMTVNVIANLIYCRLGPPYLI